MSEAVNGIEDLPAEGLRDEWSSRTVTAVDDELVAAEVDAFKVETGPCIASDPPEVGVERLLGRDEVPVGAEVGYCVDDASEVVSGCLGALGCGGCRRRGV